MPRQHLSVIAIFVVVVAVGVAWGSNIESSPRRFASFSNQYVLPAAVDFSAPLNFPSSPDNWLGGTGNWSNGADWSAGLPGSDNDVFINTGSDNVTLDTSFSINSLTLGGSSGSSQLTGVGNAHTLTIAGALTVNQSGNLYLSNDSMTAGASSTNFGTLAIEYGSAVQVNGDFTNVTTLNMGQANDSGNNTLAISGTLNNAGTMNVGYQVVGAGGEGTIVAASLNNTGTITLARGLGSTSLQVTGNGTNTGTISVTSAAAFSLAGSLTNSGTLQTEPGGFGCCETITLGTLTNTSTGTLSLAPDDSVATIGTLQNQGQINLDGYQGEGGSTLHVTADANNTGTIILESIVTMSVAGTLTNGAAAEINLRDDGDSLSAANLSNSGTINLGGWADSLQVSGALQNSGTISTVGGNPIRAASLTNSGSFQLAGSTLQVGGDVSNSGTIYTGSGGGVSSTINIAGRLTNSAAGEFSLGGNGDVANISFISNAGSVYLASGTSLTVTGGARSSANTLPGFLNTGIVDISSGATISSPLSFTQTSGQTTVDGTLRISSRGLIDFSGGSVYGNQGTLQGTVLSNAAINIGDAPMLVGQMAIMGNYTQLANGSLTFDIAGPTSGQYDQLNVSGHAQLNGLMTVDLLHGYVPQIGNTFDIMNFTSTSGTFSSVVGLPINGSEHFVLEYNPSNLTLDVESGQILGPTVTGHGAFSTNDPFIPSGEQTGNDYSLAASNNNGPAGSTPEPSSVVLFASGMIALAGVLRSRGRS